MASQVTFEFSTLSDQVVKGVTSAISKREGVASDGSGKAADKEVIQAGVPNARFLWPILMCDSNNSPRYMPTLDILVSGVKGVQAFVIYSLGPDGLTGWQTQDKSYFIESDPAESAGAALQKLLKLTMLAVDQYDARLADPEYSGMEADYEAKGLGTTFKLAK